MNRTRVRFIAILLGRGSFVKKQIRYSEITGTMQEQFEIEHMQSRIERRDARENRQLLIETAKRLFAEQSVATTTMKQIASTAGVGKGTLYRHFADKGELCRALIHEDVAVFQERVGALLRDRQQVPSAV